MFIKARHPRIVLTVLQGCSSHLKNTERFSTYASLCATKRVWTWRELSDIRQYRMENKLLFGKVVRKPKKNPQPKLTASQSSPDVGAQVEDTADTADGATPVQPLIELHEKKADNLVDRNSDEKEDLQEQELSNADSVEVQKDFVISSVKDSTDFVDYFDEEPSPSPARITKSKSMSNKETNGSKDGRTHYVIGADFPSPQSPLDHILVHPLFPNDPCAPDLPDNIIPKENLPAKLPSVTKILSDTMPPESKIALERWERDMIAELGYEGFMKLKQETFRRGRKLHSCIEQRLLGMDEEEWDITEDIQAHWQSLNHVFPLIDQVTLTEEEVQHPKLKYKGIFDCVAYYRGKLCVIDWKTSKKVKSRLQYTYDNPLQLAAYVGALNFDENHMLKVRDAVLVLAYENGSPANVFTLNSNMLQRYWRQWLKRLHKYYTKASSETNLLQNNSPHP